MKKSFSYFIKYEILNNIYSGYSFFFGTLFPLFMLVILSISAFGDLSGTMKKEAVTTLFIGMGTIVPLATVFLGYAANYSNELEKDIPSRLELFGFSPQFMLLAKLCANFLFLTMCFIFYAIFSIIIVEIQMPKNILPILVYLLSLYIFAAGLFCLAHSIANLVRKFGPTYGLTIGLYFAMMILGGNMGLSVDQFPNWLQSISGIFPNSQLSFAYLDFWMGRNYNPAPLIQSLLTFTAINLVVLLISLKVRGRK